MNSLVSVAVPKTIANLIFVPAGHLKEVNICRHSLVNNLIYRPKYGFPVKSAAKTFQ